MSESRLNGLLEIYKLHAQLADRVSQRRETANQRYAGLLTALTAFVGALFKFGNWDESMDIVLSVIGGLGVLLSISWCIVINSYRQLNSGKFKALQDLEKELPYPFFKREWDLLHKGEDRRRYWKLTVVENFLPLIFFLIFLCFAVLPYVVGRACLQSEGVQ